MSHEMRTPLNAVIGFSQLLLNRTGAPDPREVRDYADHVLRAGEHLLALTNDVLDLQRLEEGHVALDPVDIALDAAVAHVIGQLSGVAALGGVELDNHVGPGCFVRADQRRLHQVLLSIGSNAVKFNRPGGVVRWSVEPSPSLRVRLNIEDNGAGIASQEVVRLFQPFERLGKETSAIEGTGLGLIIARRLMAAMNGSLDVRSEAGSGTRVVIDMAAAGLQGSVTGSAPARTDNPAASEGTSPGAAWPSMRMLYVEDNRINAILFEEAIRLRDGVELRLAEDGDEALSQVRGWRPDVLVLDAHLPGMNGFELLGALRRETGLSDVPAFMCSADAMPDDMRRAAEAGFTGYWPKPINIAKIMSDLDALDGHRASGSRAATI